MTDLMRSNLSYKPRVGPVAGLQRMRGGFIDREATT